jgi:pyrroloquinoline quinone biosynthesis protein B
MKKITGFSMTDDTCHFWKMKFDWLALDKMVKVVILGIVQDAGYPQPCCKKDCCKGSTKKLICCLGILDKGKKYMIDCTPDFREQISILDRHFDTSYDDSHPILDGIFLTHAHMGHYTGLIHLGRESINSKEVNVYTMPQMSSFLKGNAPFSQLVTLNNISLREMKGHVILSESLTISPVLVPHRSEFTETVGYFISGSKKKILFIPDIDKFEHMKGDQIEDLIDRVDYAFLDGTFFDETEILGRKISEIPHPLISESIKRFSTYPHRDRIYFVHLNHTNPCLRDSKERTMVEDLGFHFLNDLDEFEI